MTMPFRWFAFETPVIGGEVVLYIHYNELCCQVILALGDYMSIQCHACIGGTNVGEDIRKLDYGQHVVSGTPGRVFGK